MEGNLGQHFNIARILPPHPVEVVERPRLLQCLAQNQNKKLLLILGQAAQGKSTLAACHVKRCGIPSAWVNLAPEDADAVNLYLLLIQSLNRALQEVNGVSLTACSTAYTSPRDELAVHREWAQSLLEPINIPLRVVLDGADQIHPEASSFRFLQTLLDQLPKNVHLALIIVSATAEIWGQRLFSERLVFLRDSNAKSY